MPAFLNLISDNAASARYSAASGRDRNTIDLAATVYSAGSGELACNYLNWPDMCAYCDWSALRPMSRI